MGATFAVIQAGAKGDRSVKPKYFRTSADFRRWLERHHDSADELFVGYYKKASGTPSITWPESVDEALCFGWIDGVRRSLDDRRYTIRFTPRRRGSTWSAVNVARASALIAQGLMHATGLAAFEARREDTSGPYSYEARATALAEPYDALLKKNAAAWRFFSAQPPSYRRLTSHWVNSAKREETRLGRLEKLIACSAQGHRIPETLPATKAPKAGQDQRGRRGGPPRRTGGTRRGA